MRPQIKKRLHAGVAGVIAGLAPLAIGANTFVAYLLICSFALSAQLAPGQTMEPSPPSVMPVPLNDTSASLPAVPSPPPSALSLTLEGDKDKSSTAAETPGSSSPLPMPVMPANDESKGGAPAQIPGFSLPSPTPLTPTGKNNAPPAVATSPATHLPEGHTPPEAKPPDGIVPKAILPTDSQPVSPLTGPSQQATPSGAKQTPCSDNKSSVAMQRVERIGKLIADFHRNQILVVVLVDLLVLCLVVGVLSFVGTILGNYSWYPAVLFVVFLWTWLQAETDYFWVFALGMGTAFAEIIGKFRDEPLRAIKTAYAILYHILNGIVAVFALCVLEIFTNPSTDAGDHLKKVLVAGLGAMLVMRSKLFNIKIAGEDVSFGPEQIVKIFLTYMEGAIDRIRGTERIELLDRELDMLQVDRFEKFADHVVARMRAAQTRTLEQMDVFKKELKHICSAEGPDSARDKCFEICIALLNEMGEGFALKVFKTAPLEIRQVAPPSMGQTVLERINPFAGPPREDLQYFMAYGAGMSGVRFRERLRWSEEQYSRIPAVKRCELPKYRLAFNKLDAEGTGRANLIPDETAKVEGVLYTLSKEQMHFLDKQMPHCERRTMRVMADGKSLDAEVYLALHTKESLRPNAIAVNDMINGAEERKLSPKYIKKLRELALKSATSDPQ